MLMPAAGLSAETRGTPAEAKALLQKAVQHYQKVGRKQAFADFNTNRKEWVDRDLYVFCADKRHIILANAGFPSLVGQSADGVRDVNGMPRGQAGWVATEASREGPVQAPRLHTLTGKNGAQQAFG